VGISTLGPVNTPDPARVTGGADPAATPEPDAVPDAGAPPQPEADEPDAHRPGDSTGVPTPAPVSPRGTVLPRAAA